MSKVGGPVSGQYMRCETLCILFEQFDIIQSASNPQIINEHEMQIWYFKKFIVAHSNKTDENFFSFDNLKSFELWPKDMKPSQAMTYIIQKVFDEYDPE